jgi:hypothetical protein
MSQDRAVCEKQPTQSHHPKAESVQQLQQRTKNEVHSVKCCASVVVAAVQQETCLVCRHKHKTCGDQTSSCGIGQDLPGVKLHGSGRPS